MSPNHHLKRRLGRGLSLGALWALVSSGAAKAATGGAMPWDTPLQTIENDLTGPVVVAAATIAVVLTGLGFAVGGEGTFMRRGFGIVFGLAVALMGTSAILTFFGSSAGAVF